ncbi:MAG: type II toxin-antitoxin system VapC family toxin [Acidimicrobiia bacterium]|nr:type II toxin-antitoxin system VapC family toxin [Acidimicrobiia bacterium]
MNVVVDASLVVGALVDRDIEGRWALALLHGNDLVAPHVLHGEVASALARLERSGRLSGEEATACVDEVRHVPVTLVPFDSLSDRIWELRNSLSIDDAWYVARAERSGMPLATLDGRVARSPGPTCKFLTTPTTR